MSELILNQISKVYSLGTVEVCALDEITVAIESGEMMAVMGPSGSGKSTLMHILGLLERPTSGQLFIGGKKITLSMEESELARLRSQTVGFVFQDFHLLPKLTVLQNVLLPMAYTDAPRQESRERAERLLNRVGLENRAHYFPPKLSGGEKQRVAIARALANDPQVILADEPTGNLDTATGNEIIDLLTEVNGEGKTVVLITHNEYLAKRCRRSLYLLDGKIVDESQFFPFSERRELLPR